MCYYFHYSLRFVDDFLIFFLFYVLWVAPCMMLIHFPYRYRVLIFVFVFLLITIDILYSLLLMLNQNVRSFSMPSFINRFNSVQIQSICFFFIFTFYIIFIIYSVLNIIYRFKNQHLISFLCFRLFSASIVSCAKLFFTFELSGL